MLHFIEHGVVNKETGFVFFKTKEAFLNQAKEEARKSKFVLWVVVLLDIFHHPPPPPPIKTTATIWFGHFHPKCILFCYPTLFLPWDLQFAPRRSDASRHVGTNKWSLLTPSLYYICPFLFIFFAFVPSLGIRVWYKKKWVITAK